MPQRPAVRVEERALLVVVVTVVGVEVTGDDVLEVSVLPVQVAGLDGPSEHRPVRAQLCWGEEERGQGGSDETQVVGCNRAALQLLRN